MSVKRLERATGYSAPDCLNEVVHAAFMHKTCDNSVLSMHKRARARGRALPVHARVQAGGGLCMYVIKREERA